MQSGTTFDEEKNLLALTGFGDSATVHELENVGLQNEREKTMKLDCE